MPSYYYSTNYNYSLISHQSLLISNGKPSKFKIQPGRILLNFLGSFPQLRQHDGETVIFLLVVTGRLIYARRLVETSDVATLLTSLYCHGFLLVTKIFQSLQTVDLSLMFENLFPEKQDTFSLYSS